MHTLLCTRAVVLCAVAHGLVQPHALRTQTLGIERRCHRAPLQRRRAWQRRAADIDDFELVGPAARATARAAERADEPNALVAAVGIVGLLLLAATVFTVDEVDDTPPPLGASYPRLEDWTGYDAAPRRGAAPSATTVALNPVVTPGELWAATLFQWRVFSLESDAPTGFQRGPGDPAVIELLRAVVEFFTRGQPNARRYEGRVDDEWAAGPDAAPASPEPSGAFPAPPETFDEARAVVRRCSTFVEGFGLSVTADASDGERLGLTSLRLRRLPPRSALWPREDEAWSREQEGGDDTDAGDYRYAAYITGLAVARSARRRGVASTLVDYAERKGAAWGADGLCLHVNRLNTPALRLYDRLGFSVVPDWYGYNNQRFLLHKPLNGEAPETPPAMAPRTLSPLQKEILGAGGTEPPGSASEKGGLDFELTETYGTAFPADGAYRCVRCAAKVYWARQKMKCGCGWPAFYDCVDGAVEERPECNDPLSSAPPKYGVEAVCKACDGHLGHVIRGEGLGTPTDARHCVNGAVLRYDSSAEGQPGDIAQMPAELLGQ